MLPTKKRHFDGVGSEESLDHCYGNNLFVSFPQDSYTMPLTSIQCWHVHCEECWLRTLVRLLTAFLLTFSSLLRYFILDCHREGCFLLYFKQFECYACRFPKPGCLTPHSGFDMREFWAMTQVLSCSLLFPLLWEKLCARGYLAFE